MKKKFLIIWISALILNIIWELSHYHLYQDLSGISKYPHLLLASFTDSIIILILFLKTNIKKPNYPLIISTFIIIALIIELINLKLGRWQYTDSMPKIWIIGISPLIQLAITGVASLIITKNIVKT